MFWFNKIRAKQVHPVWNANWQRINKKRRVLCISLQRVRIQEIKHMPLVNFTHDLFLTCTQKYIYIYKSLIAVFAECTAFPSKSTPCIIDKTTPLYFLGEPASLLVVTNSHPPLSLVCQQLPHPWLLPLLPFHTPHFKLHYLHRQLQQSRSPSAGTLCNISIYIYCICRCVFFQNLANINTL